MTMNMDKIGAFITECRKSKELTQKEIADKLLVTDRAVSKWERGKSMPDISLMQPLCEVLEISLSELLIGEHVPQQNKIKRTEERLMHQLHETRISRSKQRLVIFLSIAQLAIIVTFWFLLITLGDYFTLPTWAYCVAGALFFIGICIFVVTMFGTASYVCGKCGAYINPSFWNWALRIKKFRHDSIYCKNCGKRQWSTHTAFIKDKKAPENNP